MYIRFDMKIKMGRVVKYFVLSDFFLLGGWGFIEPVFSIFIVERIPGASLETVGIVAAIYWILRSVLEIPIANYLDRTPGERDDYRALIGALLLASISALSFLWVRDVWTLYILQALHAVAFAFYLPSWTAIFSRHLDKDHISFDWAVNSTTAGIAAGISGLLSGIIAEMFGFSAIFIVASVLSFVSFVILVLMPDIVLPKPTTKEAPITGPGPMDLAA